MSKQFFTIHKNSKVKLFLFFLFLAIIFWILTKFSRDFTSVVEASVNYKNIPETAALSKNNIHQITFDLTANGFELMFYKLKKPSLSIDVDAYFSEDTDGFKISKNELIRLIAGNFNRSVNVKNLSIEELYVQLDAIVLKKVKVVAQTDIVFKKGFKAVDSIKIVPDSVSISGPLGSLKDISVINTELIVAKDIDKDFSEKVKIASLGNEIVAISPEKVMVSLAVSEFSQGKMAVPVELINVPPSISIKLIPETVTVSFDISVLDFAAVVKEDFRVVCDFSKQNNEENFMLPDLLKKPKGAVNVEFNPKKIDFLIFK